MKKRYGYALMEDPGSEGVASDNAEYSSSLATAENRASLLAMRHRHPVLVWDTEMNVVVAHVGASGTVKFTAAHPRRRNPSEPITATKTRSGGMKVCRTVSRRESDRMTKFFMRAVRSKPGTVVRGNPTSKRNIALPPEVVTALFEWHGGQSTPTYSLASTGQGHTVSLDMIKAAEEELERVYKRLKPRTKERTHLRRLLGELDTIQRYPEEYKYDE